jgi:hypothetical protein
MITSVIRLAVESKCDVISPITEDRSVQVLLRHAMSPSDRNTSRVDQYETVDWC